MRIRVVDGVPLPVNSILASLCICVIIALLNLVGDRVFNSIVGLLTGTLGMTYALSIGCVLWRRCFGEPLPPARWSLGRWGLPCNIIAFLYSLMSLVISFFPLFNSTGASDMNWSVSIRSATLADMKLTITFSTGPAPSSLSSLS
jgi:choline transport protein